MDNLNGNFTSDNKTDKSEDKESKKSSNKLNEKSESKGKIKESTPKNSKGKEQDSTQTSVPTIDTSEPVENDNKLNESNESNQSIQANTELIKDQTNSTQTNTDKQIDYDQVVKLMSLDDIFINLNLIAKIEVGDKLYINDKYINIDMSYAKSVLRWFYGIDRKTTIGFVRLIINKSFEFCEKLTDTKLKFRLNNDLKNSINGLVKLKQTYLADKLVQAEIDVIIEDIRLKIESNLITN